MKNSHKIYAIFLIILFASAGCGTTKDIKRTVNTMTSNVDEDLYAQVPEDERGEAQKAEFDLKVSEDEHDLADLKKDLAVLKKKYADYDLDIAKKNQKQAVILLKFSKLEAIERSGLGNKENNIKTLADFESKKLRIEADKVKVIAKLTTTQLRIDTLEERIKDQEQYIGAAISEETEGKGDMETANPNAEGLEQ